VEGEEEILGHALASVVTGEKEFDETMLINMHDRHTLALGLGRGQSPRGQAHGLVGLDARTGKRRWSVLDCLGVWASPVCWRHGGNTYAIAATGKRCAAVDVQTGEILWNVEGRFAAQFGVAVGGDYLLTHGNFHKGDGTRTDDRGRKPIGPACYRLSSTGVELIWNFPPESRASILGSCPIVYRDHAYIFLNGKPKRGLACVELKTGKVVATARPGGGGYASAVAADGRVALSNGTMYNADPAELRLLDGELPGFKRFASLTSPTLAGGRLYYRGGDAIHCYELRRQPPPVQEKPAPSKLPEDVAALARIATAERWPEAQRAAARLRASGAAAAGVAETLAAAVAPAVERGSWGDAWLLTATLQAVHPPALANAAARLADQAKSGSTLAVRVLGECGENGKPGVSALATLLQGEDVETARLAALSLQRIGPAAAAAAPALAALLGHDDLELRFRAARALGAIGDIPGSAVNPLIDVFVKDPRFVWIDPDFDINRKKDPPWVAYRHRGWVGHALRGLNNPALAALRKRFAQGLAVEQDAILASLLLALDPDGHETREVLRQRTRSAGTKGLFLTALLGELRYEAGQACALAVLEDLDGMDAKKGEAVAEVLQSFEETGAKDHPRAGDSKQAKAADNVLPSLEEIRMDDDGEALPGL